MSQAPDLEFGVAGGEDFAGRGVVCHGPGLKQGSVLESVHGLGDRGVLAASTARGESS